MCELEEHRYHVTLRVTVVSESIMVSLTRTPGDSDSERIAFLISFSSMLLVLCIHSAVTDIEARTTFYHHSV